MSCSEHVRLTRWNFWKTGRLQVLFKRKQLDCYNWGEDLFPPAACLRPIWQGSLCADTLSCPRAPGLGGHTPWLQSHTVSPWMCGLPAALPPITRSIACSKCFWFMESERCLAAIKAASLHTLATSAPVKEHSSFPSDTPELTGHSFEEGPDQVPTTSRFQRPGLPSTTGPSSTLQGPAVDRHPWAVIYLHRPHDESKLRLCFKMPTN